MPEERLQKIMASAGVASRRASEKLIEAGRVQVDGVVVTELGTKVDPEQVEIHVDGQPISQPKRHVYYKVYKPRGVLSDIGGDTRGRQTVADLLPENARRVFPVGRLDLISEGMVLLTDDGMMANRLTHPRYEHPKVYYVLVEKMPTMTALESLRTGIDLPTGRTQPCQVMVVKRLPNGLILDEGNVKGIWLQMVLREGKKRQIRHMTAAVGYPTQRLVRWAIGPVTAEGVKPGEYRRLTGPEVAALREMIGETPRPTTGKSKAKSNETKGQKSRFKPGRRERPTARGKGKADDERRGPSKYKPQPGADEKATSRPSTKPKRKRTGGSGGHKTGGGR